MDEPHNLFDLALVLEQYLKALNITAEPKTPGVPWCSSLVFLGEGVPRNTKETPRKHHGSDSVVFPHVQKEMCWEIINCHKGIGRMI